ncbi:MAG: glycosyltransferase [Armatimonadetes bacterium]|nr:glycosyltransferase [Armatimonadota bacterium]
MRILFIAPYVPSRIRVRPFQFIKGLAERHKVHVIALGGADKADAGGVEEIARVVEDLHIVPHPSLRGYCQSLLALPTPSPMCTAFCWSRAMKQAVADAIRGARFDVIHVEHLRAAHFPPVNTSLPMVFDSVDCLTGLFRQMAKSRKSPLARMLMAEEAWKLRRYEPRALSRFDRNIVTSESEREELLSLDGTLPIQVVPNGVDTDYFQPMDTDRHPRRVVFSGKMSYRPNAQAAMWFAEDVFPHLRKKWSDAEFVIVGSGPPPEIRKLGERPGITVTGYVDDIRPHLASSSVAVVPMRIAVGIQNKVLEAMAMGIPVVTCGPAARAFGADCPGIVVADSAEDTLQRVSELIVNAGAAREMGANGRAAVEERFSWQRSVAELEALYEEVRSGRIG